MKKIIAPLMVVALTVLALTVFVSPCLSQSHSITFVSHTYNSITDISTWTYTVTSGICPFCPSISHWVLTWCNKDALVKPCSEDCEYVTHDPENTGLTGIKFDKGYAAGGEIRTVWFELLGDWPESSVEYGIKAGSDVVYGWVTGPVCNGLPECSITCDPANCAACEGDSVTLTEVGGDAVSWLWSTGETSQSITVTTSGTYSVTVTDTSGRSNTCTKDVTVYELPPCEITAPDAVCENSVGNTASTIAGYSTYTWSLSAGTITAGQDTNSITWTAPSHTASPVTISVTVTDAYGRSNTCTKDVTVYDLPPCEITAPDAVCENSEGNTASTIAGYSTYTWSLSAGTITAGQDTNSITWTAPSHTASPVNISVTVIDANNCMNTCYKDVTVYAFKPSINIIKTASLTGTCPGSDPLAVNISDTVTYCFNVTNTGDVNLTSITVIDSIYGPVPLAKNDTLAPGESIEGTVQHKVVESDKPSVTNIANATGTDPFNGTVNDTDDCTIIVKTQPEVELEKTGSPAIVAPGGNVTYTINYTNTGTVPLHNVVITEHYPKGVTFISADPAPDVGNNVWIIGTLGPGESGTIVIKVKVPEQIDLYFTETGSVIGEGVVMVTKDLSTEQKPYSLRNSVTLSCDELAPKSAYATTKVSGVPGTSLGITESGSGVYSSDEILDLETKNKTIILKKSTHAEYKPTSFNFSDSFSVNFTNKWKQDICSKNMEIGAAIHKKISDATYIDDETISRVDKDKSIMNFDSSFNGSMYIGARTKDTEISETYIGEFDVLQTIHIAKGPIPTPAPTPTPIWLPCPFNASPEMNMTEEAEPTP